MSQIWDIYCKHCLWSIFGPCWCTKPCKTTFYAHLSRIWKLARFTRFIRKVFATKILLSGKFSLFVTLLLPARFLCHSVYWNRCCKRLKSYVQDGLFIHWIRTKVEQGNKVMDGLLCSFSYTNSKMEQKQHRIVNLWMLDPIQPRVGGRSAPIVYNQGKNLFFKQLYLAN